MPGPGCFFCRLTLAGGSQRAAAAKQAVTHEVEGFHSAKQPLSNPQFFLSNYFSYKKNCYFYSSEI